ncbi:MULTISPECIES: FHA domain-containing protein [Streptomyces]|uniref:FHA domain-containing protein n=1 Tax=Streptomyces TaxID=1883 RepID=UPI0010390B90|nr:MULTISPECIES: FHA domain-containing protein [Streptomyces]MBT3073326.1 FHA domain-containing protein [Streptomyces sp. COG21]MBT3083232.1 FHA domain-containing protein [Streptomyces sp. COG20]MBT3088710.1 FHA domain-containing protein [Streptomyces sp. CYG21]MBT3099111.1 FHA domain-containing protein [Streptomyces sp. CBG30]MBT3102130.1 FHA domain-containing protein [Streptomyces sp. COG19]
MQIRLTVLAPRSGQTPARACDVLVTAPAGTALAAVASGLAQAVSGPEGSQGGGAVVLFAGRERLDAQRIALGEPPLVDGAVLSLQVPGEDEATDDTAPAQLHVVAGPDAGGVHLLHGGQIRIGRSAEADVPLDDPDVSRLHCAVTVAEDGRVSVADLGSTNGTSLDGTEVRDRPVRFPPGALLRLGESTLRLTAGPRAGSLPTAPDGEGHLRVSRADPAAHGPVHGGPGTSGAFGAGSGGFDGSGGPAGLGEGTGQAYGEPSYGGQAAAGASGASSGASHAEPVAYGHESQEPGPGHGQGASGTVPARRAPEGGETPRRGGIGAWARRLKGGGGSRGGEQAQGAERPGRDGWPEAGAAPDGHAYGQPYGHAYGDGHDSHPYGDGHGHGRAAGAPGSGAYAAPSAGAAGAAGSFDSSGSPGSFGAGGDSGHLASPVSPLSPFSAVPSAPEGTWPDPAAVLLTALGPGPRLWERHEGHPEALVVRLGTTDRADVPSVPVTVGLREAGSLGLAGPRARLAGLARATVAQLAALHSPFDLEIVLISTDRSRSLEERRREWSWLGWLPHLRPMHGQDCRLLLAYDREQADARTAELVRRLDEGPFGPGWPNLDRTEVAEAARAHKGPHTVVVLDGDPGTAALRETTARLAGAGAAAGIHLICLAETPAASPTSPVAATYDAACRASIAFRECGAVAMLSGDVATALRLLRTAGGQAAGHGTVAAVDAVSAAWAERFGRALAPLRDEGSAALAGRPTTAALPPSARLLDELGLARATPASLMARWASTADDQPGASLPRPAAAPSRTDLETPGSGRTLSAGPRVGPQRTAAEARHSQDTPTSGRIPYPGDPASGRTPYPGTEDRGSGRTAYPGDPASGRTPYPGAGDRDSDRTPYPGDPGTGRTPYQGADARDSGRTPYPSATHQDSGRTPYPGAESLSSGRTPYPGTDSRGSGRTPYPGADGRGSGRTPYPGAGSRDSSRTLYPDTDDLDYGHTPYPAPEPRSSGRTPYPGADSRDSARTPYPDPGRTPYPGADARESRGTPYPGAHTRDSERTPYPGAEARDSGRVPRVGPQGGEAPGQAGDSGRPVLVLGAGPRGPLSVDLADEGPHLLIEGPAGSGRTELLRAVAASLAASARPDRLGILLVDGAGGKPEERGEGLLPCTELPHVFTHLVASDPVRMREFAQALGGELKRRAELLGPLDFATWHARHAEAAEQTEPRRVVGQRPPSGAERRGDLDSPASGTLRLRQVAARASDPGPSPLPRLVVLADDFDALVAPGLGSPGRPAAGSVVRALEAVARDGGRLGVHLVATSARPDRTEDTELARGARLRIVLDAPVLPPSPDEPAPGRGRLGHPDGRVTPFQGGRVTGRIPRTATLRPTVVPLEWERMGDPPTRRPVRELGNGPTDLALLASALERAARSVNAERLPPLIPFPT